MWLLPLPPMPESVVFYIDAQARGGRGAAVVVPGANMETRSAVVRFWSRSPGRAQADLLRIEESSSSCLVIM